MDYIFNITKKIYTVISDICPKCILYHNDVIHKIIQFNIQYHIVDNSIWMLSNDFIEILINKFTLMESMLLIDGLICGIIFVKNYFILKVTSKNINKKLIVNLNKEIVNTYNSIYRLNVIDRYTFYFIIYCIYNSHVYFKYWFLILLLITIPYIQNSICSIYFINNILNNYIQNKQIFVKYCISKISVHFIQQLHPQIDNIPNYHIFIIYNNLSYTFIFNIIKYSLFILLLNILRSYESTYYYYKAIKLAYMHSSGYLYNIIPLDNAIYLANLIIKEKRWREFQNINIVNGFFILVINKYDLLNNGNIPFNINAQIILFQISSLWAFVSLFKMIVQLHLISNITFTIFLIFLFSFLVKFNIKNIITTLIACFLIIFNTNDLIITLVIINNKIIYYFIVEVLFFIKNISNIKKVINTYTHININDYDIIS